MGLLMKPKILIVDDSKTARLVVVGALQGFECDLLEAADGAEGLALARSEKPDLLLLDVAMPDMDGLEMLGKLRADRSLRETPVVMLTSQAGRQAVTRIIRLGVRDYLVKPFTEEVLVERVGRILDLRPKGEPAAPAKRFEDALAILVVDDKTAIPEQIKQALADTTWQIETRAQSAEAIEFCSQTPPDAVLVSLSLPGDAALALFEALRSGTRTRKVPVLGLSVITAVEEQKRALENGFSGIITKPIRADHLKAQLCRVLQLDITGKYFEEREGVLLLRPPLEAAPAAATEILGQLRTKAVAAVEAGFDKIVIDLGQTEQVSPAVLRQTLSAVQLCEELALNYRLAGCETLSAECRKQQEAKNWKFAASVDEAIGDLTTVTAA
jgi:two-component system, cell cycle response regulator